MHSRLHTDTDALCISHYRWLSLVYVPTGLVLLLPTANRTMMLRQMIVFMITFGR